ncbi:hypothetical protein ACFYP3_21410, partial [Streptomyces sp. NPDC005533]
PLGAPLTELPPTATPADRPAATPALPMVQRAEPDNAEPKPGAQRQAEPAAGAAAPVQRARSRAPLGAPLTELPPTATPAGRPAPALPMVQRQAEPSAGAEPAGRAAPRVRTGLGAPLTALPPSAAPPVPASSRARAAARPLSHADIQRALAVGAASTPTGHAPVPGTGAVQRRTGTSATPATPAGSAHPVPLVVARSVTDKTAGHAPTTPPAPRTLQLLAARPLPFGTRDMGSAAAPAPRPAGRPVVAARWPAASSAPQQVQRAAVDGPRGGHGPRPPHVVRPAPGPRPAPASAPARAAATPLPVTGPQAPPVVVQPAPAVSSARPVPVVRPRTPAAFGTPGPPAPAPAAAGVPQPAGPPPVQRAPGGTPSGPGPTSRGPGGGGGATSRSAPADRRAAPQVPDADLDDLARRLLDPVSRLLRTELRRGRERAGRPFDGRR